MNLNDFLSTLNDTQAQASKVPDLERRVRELEASLAAKDSKIDSLETDHLKALEEIDQKASSIRSLEVERDNAGFRANDAEDKLKKILSVVGPAPTVAQPVTEAKVIPFVDTPAQTVDTPPATSPSPVSSQAAEPVGGAIGEPVVATMHPYNPADDAYKPVEAGPVSPSTDYSPGDTTLLEVPEMPDPYKAPEVDPYTRDGRQSSYIDDQGNRRRWNYTLSRWDTEAKESAPSSHYSPDSLR